MGANVLFLFPDQLRADFLSCYGASFIDTPGIDRLAERGVRYANAYSPHPLCVPARVSLLTGMNAVMNGVLDNGQFLRPDHRELGIHGWPELLQRSGYYTGAIGKMHFYPWDLNPGFHYRRTAEDKRWIFIQDDYYHHLKSHGYGKYHAREHPDYQRNKGAIVSRIPWQFSVDHFVGQETCSFIRQYKDKRPFALMVGFPGPHDPYDPSLEYAGQVDPNAVPLPISGASDATPLLRQRCMHENREPWNGIDYSDFTLQEKKRVRAYYAALVRQIDVEVGNILEALEDRGLLSNTVIIFSSDHGDYLGDHDLIGKGSFYQSSIRIPLIVSAPNAQKAVCDSLVSLTDVTSTILAIAGCAAAGCRDSLPLPALGLPGGGQHSQIMGVLDSGLMILDGEWKLAKYTTGETVLFNVARDPEEQENLLGLAKYFEIGHSLDSKLTEWLMGAVVLSHNQNRVYGKDYSQDPDFGRRGWRRPFPHS